MRGATEEITPAAAHVDEPVARILVVGSERWRSGMEPRFPYQPTTPRVAPADVEMSPICRRGAQAFVTRCCCSAGEVFRSTAVGLATRTRSRACRRVERRDAGAPRAWCPRAGRRSPGDPWGPAAGGASVLAGLSRSALRRDVMPCRVPAARVTTVPKIAPQR